PVYYFVTPEFAAFTSALRIFEAAGIGIGKIDVRGIYETCTFGFPLGDRTFYEGIRTIGPAEIIRITRNPGVNSKYFEWDRLPETADDEEGLVPRLVKKFEDGVRRR